MEVTTDLPRIAILLATYNGALHVGEQLASITRQRNVDWHLFIRDDGSSDSTVELVHKAGIAVDKLTILVDEIGPTGSACGNFLAMTAAVDTTSFNYFSFADQDDIWLADKLERAISCMKDHQASAYSSNLTTFTAARSPAGFIRKDQPQKRWDYLFQGASAGCTYVLDRQAMTLVQTVVRSMSEAVPSWISHDWFIYALCRSTGLTWFQDPEARILYRQHAANVYGAQSGLSGLWQRAALARSGWYRRHVLWILSRLDLDDEGIAIASAVRRMNLTDRLWLVARCGQFRRKRRESALLAAAILTGFF